ncbi:gamma-glutamylcyclotransferase [Rhodobacter sp. Har01]|uniref:gamma-glutamylcyclotransferase n=1 Tax=Rhodobacter sp. Har01 TaxID=2883999 RepID=UPI001D07B8AA|nr:gamma-glutamylcyclotransferase [Rhodobacter sp. Har01]MCB6179172.1 gamma-glutamylcyclotransferase [Rhodobacter sp. Har01]
MHDALWIFGYGSLIWNPEFPVAERRLARATGWHRSFCMHSIHFRGTPQAPGLVLALDRAPDAVCHGVALRAEPGSEAATLAALRKRELISSAYLEGWLDLDTAEGPLRALAYVIDRDHAQYCGGLSLEDQAAIIAQASGGRGPNRDYLWATSTHLADLGLADPDLEWLAARVRVLSD